jgi:hypothetical protein
MQATVEEEEEDEFFAPTPSQKNKRRKSPPQNMKKWTGDGKKRKLCVLSRNDLSPI